MLKIEKFTDICMTGGIMTPPVQDYLCHTMGQHTLNSLAINCIECTYVNRMDKVIDIFGQRHGRKNFFF